MVTCIKDNAEVPQKLNIALLGYNNTLTKCGFKQLIKNNVEQIDEIFDVTYTAYLKDGTKIQAITQVDEQCLKGRKFDQLILFDYDRWLTYNDDIKWKMYEEINDKIDIIKTRMVSSNVPEKFQILEYEDIR